MKKSVSLRKYIAGFIIGLSLVATVSYAANTGSIGSLFTAPASKSGDYELSGIHISDNTIGGNKILNYAITPNKLDDTGDFIMNSLSLAGNTIGKDKGVSILTYLKSTHNTQSALAFKNSGGMDIGHVIATSQSIGFSKPIALSIGPDDVKPVGGWLLKINKTTGNVGIGGLEPATTGPNKSVTAGAFFYSSDRRLKENITTLDNSLEKVQNLRGVSFNWKKGGAKDLGVIAQEVEKVYPELVGTDSKGMKSVKYANLVGVLIEAVKEQQVQIEELKSRVDSLERNSK